MSAVRLFNTNFACEIKSDTYLPIKTKDLVLSQLAIYLSRIFLSPFLSKFCINRFDFVIHSIAFCFNFGILNSRQGTNMLYYIGLVAVEP